MKISTILDTRYANEKGLYPAKIRVSHHSKADLFPTGQYMSKDTFRNVQGKECLVRNHNLQQELLNYEERIWKIIKQLSVYSVEAVRIVLKQGISTSGMPAVNDVCVWFEWKAKDCINTKESYGNAKIYRGACGYYKRYFNKEVLPFHLFTPAVLHRIQKEATISHSTIGIYSRHLRAIFNLAIDARFISPDLYPFGKNRYVPPTARKRKHALSKEALTALIEYQTADPRERFHLDLFLFSFYGNGLNMKDVATLKWGDIDRQYIIKKREKTRNTSQREDIKIYLMPEIQTIIDRHGTKDKNPRNYIFPILDRKMTSEQVFKEARRMRDLASRTLGWIGAKLGIEGNIPHGTSRHCFANALKQAGAPIELISETIGHSSVAVTKHYTSDFEEAGLTYQAYLLKYTGKK